MRKFQAVGQVNLLNCPYPCEVWYFLCILCKRTWDENSTDTKYPQPPVMWHKFSLFYLWKVIVLPGQGLFCDSSNCFHAV